ncbi:MAG TPA: PilZ domain-containing protein [Gemmataceae bacterium]|nr:PilZ domain-containing protein [Gemmataceae bacterium]
MDSAIRIENRAVPRVAGDTVGPLTLCCEAPSLSVLAPVHDVSVMGIGLICTRSVKSGTTIRVTSGPSGRALPRDLLATVRHVTSLPDGRWLLGCSFSRNLTLADFEVLG